MRTSRLRRRAVLATLTVALSGAGLISIDGTASARALVTASDSIATATPIDMSGETSSTFLPVSNDAATANDDAADNQLTTAAGLAQHTVWFKFDPAPGSVSISVTSSIASIVAGVVTTSTDDADLNGVSDSFAVVSNTSVINDGSDSDEAGSALVDSTLANQTETFSFTNDSADLISDGDHDFYLGVGSVGADGSAPTGTIDISASHTDAPANDDFADATPITTGTTDYPGDTTGATPELDGGSTDLDPVVDGQPSMYSVWYSFTAPRNGRVALSTAGSSFPVVFQVCQSTVPSAADCANSDVVDSGIGATPITSTTFEALDGETYYLFLDGQADAQAHNAFGAYNLRFAFSPAPINDDISTPTVLSPSGVDRVTGTNVGAQDVVLGDNPPTTITPESTYGLTFDGGGQLHSVWYRYKPHKSAAMVLYTTGSLNTDVEVFTGNLASGFSDTHRGNDNYSATDRSSRFPLSVRAGRIYYIGVDGSTMADYPEGSFGLSLGAVPANDNLGHASFLAKTKAKVGKKKHATVSKAKGKVRGTTDFATFQSRQKSPNHYTGGADVWYTFVAPKAGRYTFTESLRGRAALLAAYSGKGSSNLGLKLVKAAAHPGTTKPASIRIKAKAGQKFSISVDGSAGGFGSYALTWR